MNNVRATAEITTKWTLYPLTKTMLCCKMKKVNTCLSHQKKKKKPDIP